MKVEKLSVSLRDRGREFHIVSLQQRKAFSQSSPNREVRNCQQTGFKRVQHPKRMVWVTDARKIGWHVVVTETPKTQTTNFVSDPSLHWRQLWYSEP